MAATRLALGNDYAVRLTGLRNALTAAYLNAATVTAQLYDAGGAAVGDPVTLTYTPASNGDYAGVIESTVVDAGFAEGDVYRLAVAAAQGGVTAEFNATGTVGRRAAG